MIDRRMFVGGGAALACVGARGTSALDEVVARFATEKRFNGAIAHARRGRIDLMRTYGVADVATERPITAETAFAFGSASKWLATAATLRLVEQGRLDLDRPITAWLPGFRTDTGARLTLRFLLSNTSGLPDRLSAAVGSEPALRTSTEGSAAMVARFAGGDLVAAPGAAWDYSLLNWVIVHAIIERVTGEPFARIMKQLVFAPLGMAGATLVDTLGGRTERTASGYASLVPPVPKMAPVPPFAAASGDVFATAADALRAAHGIFATSFLSPASRTALTTVRWAPENYALGGRVRVIGGRRWAWESGKVQGYRALIAHDLTADRGIAIFNNTDMEQAPIAALAEAMIAA